MKHSSHFWAFAAVAAAILSAGCGGGKEEAAAPAAAPKAAAVDPATLGAVKGAVVFEGAAPKRSKVVMKADPVCHSSHSADVFAEDVIINENGSLKNVFVYVKEGVKGSFPVPKEPALLNQEGCMYAPRISGIRAGQPLDILNSDNTLHNVHAMPVNNPEFNMGQPVKGQKNTKVFPKTEVMVKFKCDVHPWMGAYMGVLDHPFFAVTGNDGSFELKGLPPGDYVVEAWHETFGTQTVNVTVGPTETKEISYSFKAS